MALGSDEISKFSDRVAIVGLDEVSRDVRKGARNLYLYGFFTGLGACSSIQSATRYSSVTWYATNIK